MNAFKLLLVEDDQDAIKIFESDLKRFKAEQNIEDGFIECAVAISLDTAIDLLDKSQKDFDGAIIDLKLGEDDSAYSGNELIQEIKDKYRIPLAIYTGTPLQAESQPQHIKVYKRGQHSYREVLEELYGWYQTGITQVAGGRGLIEEKLDEIFWKYLLPQIEIWKKHCDSDPEFEKTLLRFTVNHLMEYLEDDSDKFISDEVYISPPIRKDTWRTGCIVKSKQDETCYVILTPACDLVLRENGDPKTSDILLCEIETLDAAHQQYNKKKRERLAKNSENLFNHFLPQAHRFEGGIINFRKIKTIPYSSFKEAYSTPLHQISSTFVKDIVARFSIYYSRQGQPSFDASDWIKPTTELPKSNT